MSPRVQTTALLASTGTYAAAAGWLLWLAAAAAQWVADGTLTPPAGLGVVAVGCGPAALMTLLAWWARPHRCDEDRTRALVGAGLLVAAGGAGVALADTLAVTLPAAAAAAGAVLWRSSSWRPWHPDR